MDTLTATVDTLTGPIDVLTGLLLVLSVASVFLCYFIAKARKADTRKWIILGVLFGPLAVPFVFFASPKNRGS